jgi:hypothetical protein
LEATVMLNHPRAVLPIQTFSFTTLIISARWSGAPSKDDWLGSKLVVACSCLLALGLG